MFQLRVSARRPSARAASCCITLAGIVKFFLQMQMEGGKANWAQMSAAVEFGFLVNDVRHKLCLNEECNLLAAIFPIPRQQLFRPQSNEWYQICAESAWHGARACKVNKCLCIFTNTQLVACICACVWQRFINQNVANYKAAGNCQAKPKQSKLRQTKSNCSKVNEAQWNRMRCQFWLEGGGRRDAMANDGGQGQTISSGHSSYS